MKVGDTLDDDKYVLRGGPHQGGMSLVFKAEVLKGALAGQFVAIKTPRDDKADAEAKRAFYREAAALRLVSGHPNIIRHIDDGAEPTGRTYLVLEWLEHTLVDEIDRRGAMSWEEWHKDIGGLVLDGLVHAHGLDQCHRDLSPANIMFDQLGVVKITDFGLAAAAERVRSTGTFAAHGSLPFTPAELDNGLHSRARDCFSWAVLTTCALAGRLFSDLGQVRGFLANANPATVPVDILLKAMSDSPHLRHRVARELQSELVSFEFRRLLKEGRPCVLRLEGMVAATTSLCSATGSSELRHAMVAVANELNLLCSCALDNANDEKLRLVGGTLEILALFKKDFLLVSGGRRIDLMAAQKKRDGMLSVPVQFRAGSFQKTSQDVSPRAFRELLIQADFQQQEVQAELERVALLEQWAKYLNERLGRALKPGYKLKYTDVTSVEEDFLLRVAGDIELELLGSDLIARGSNSELMQLSLVGLVGDEMRVRPRNQEFNHLPVNGYLERDPYREKVAIERQRQGLEMVRGRQAASYGAIAWITNPATCPLPERSGVMPVPGLSADKLEILDAALGVQSVITVAGPPGTGKTTLIAALVKTYLSRYPNQRILIASQTHVAIDNAIQKIVLDDTISLVRIGDEKEEKIAEASKPFLIERRFRAWAEKIRERAQLFLNAFAEANGLNLDEVVVSLLFSELNTIEDQLPGLEEEIARLREEHERLSNESRTLSGKDGEVGDTNAVSDTLAASGAVQELEERKESLERLVRDANGRLASIPGYGNSLASMARADRDEWVTAFFSRSGKANQLRKMIGVQQAWLASLSDKREFEYAVLTEARVVAGTCVGIARDAFFKDSFDLCIIDEAGKATATETLIPLSRSRRWILVGDRRQLPPFIEADRVKKGGNVGQQGTRQKTLLDRFDEKLPSECKFALKEQRRMCWSIGELIAKTFYDDMVIDNVRPDAARAAEIVSIYPSPVTWISTSKIAAKEEEFRKSRRNPKEAEIVVAELERLAAAIPIGESIEIAVIAGYAAQARQIDDALKGLRARRPELHINCNSVDAFQGKEADVCFYSVTRSNNDDRLGFLKEAARLNVALSRARDALVIVGDDAFCRACPAPNPFVGVLQHVDNNPMSCMRVFYAGN